MTTNFRMFKFNLRYFLLAILLFIIEVMIALYAHDRVVRPYVGDMLVVVLIYCFWKSFVNAPVLKAAIGVLLFAYFIEILQLLNFIKYIGLQNSKPARIILGYSFEWIDIIAYTVGIALVLVCEYYFKRKL